jgi:four helix bundle protein
MARDHRKLRVFQDAHRLTVAIYKHTRNFPSEEWFGMRTQIRRAAVSVGANLVEGSARRTTSEYLHFLNIARGSGAELSYLVDLSTELGLLARDEAVVLNRACQQLVPQLESLVQQVDALQREEQATQRERRTTGRRNAGARHRST